MKKVFYLGPEGSYSSIVAFKILNQKDYQFISCTSFLEIVTNTINTRDAIGVLPIENSITSDIHENIDFLFKNNLAILREAFLRINLHLLGFPHATVQSITSVYSHPRALAQCSKYIASHKLKIHEVSSTSAAKEMVLEKQDKTAAVIGSKELAIDGKLTILSKHTGNDRFNLTRFVFIAADEKLLHPVVKNKATIIFKVMHTPGSLAKLLNEFAKSNINLTKIESRPIPGTSWEYEFWIDIENVTTDLNIPHILDILKKSTLSYKVIGMYQTGEIFES